MSGNNTNNSNTRSRIKLTSYGSNDGSDPNQTSDRASSKGHTSINKYSNIYTVGLPELETTYENYKESKRELNAKAYVTNSQKKAIIQNLKRQLKLKATLNKSGPVLATLK